MIEMKIPYFDVTKTIPVRQLVPFGKYPDGKPILWALVIGDRGTKSIFHFETGTPFIDRVNMTKADAVNTMADRLERIGIRTTLKAIATHPLLNKVPRRIKMYVYPLASWEHSFMRKT